MIEEKIGNDWRLLADDEVEDRKSEACKEFEERVNKGGLTVLPEARLKWWNR